MYFSPLSHSHCFLCFFKLNGSKSSFTIFYFLCLLLPVLLCQVLMFHEHVCVWLLRKYRSTGGLIIININIIIIMYRHLGAGTGTTTFRSLSALSQLGKLGFSATVTLKIVICMSLEICTRMMSSLPP